MPIVLALLVLLSAPLSAQRIQRPQPSGLTRACGSEIPWLSDFDAALQKAAEAKRPVFWYVPTLGRSPMDRKDVIDFYMKAGPFSSPRVATLISRRFIPLQLAPRGALQRRFGLERLRFIEPGFLVLLPDGKEVGRLDRLTTFNELWMVGQIRRLLSASGLTVPAAQVAAAGDDVEAAAAALLDEGDWKGAGELLARLDVRTPELDLLRARALVGVGDHDAAGKLLVELARPAAGDVPRRAALHLGRFHLGRGRPDLALPLLARAAKARFDGRREARFFEGVCHRLLGDDPEARGIWTRLAREKGVDRWVRKAAAEAEGFGPFDRGFETFRFLAKSAFLEQPEGTRLPVAADRVDAVVRSSMRHLIEAQRKSGVWDDSNYDFGGRDSLPNVYAAVSALCAQALDEWKEIDLPGRELAVRKALGYLLEEKHIASEDRDELLWAHAYRLRFFDRLLRAPKPPKKVGPKARRVIALMRSTQSSRSGAFRHEYGNPFATATALQSLDLMKQRGLKVDAEVMKKAAEALESCRGDDGTFSYGMPRRGRRGSRVQGAAGRMPLCELALLIAGRSDQKRLCHAIEASFEHHELLEAVRKYDDHADRYANGGFFFWYDQLGRADAILAVEDPQRRERYKAQQLALLLKIAEIDGTFVDSHELGKSYGTAMALLCLKRLLPEGS